MKFTLKGNVLTAEFTLFPTPTVSKSQKSLLIAGSNGTVNTGIVIDGKPLMFSANAYVSK